MATRGLFVDARAGVVHAYADCPAASGPIAPISRKQASDTPPCQNCQERGASQTLPATAHIGSCRLCGTTAPLTFEHIPPAAAYNRDIAHEYGVEDILPEVEIAPRPGGRQMQRGVGGYTLCDSCNPVTGARYGTEYARWAATAHAAIGGVDVDDLQEQDSTTSVVLAMEDAEVYPGRVVRQVLSMMCSVSEGELRRRVPVVTDIVLKGTAAALPTGVLLTIALAPDPNRCRITGSIEVEDEISGKRGVVAELVRYPFAFMLVLEGELRPLVLGADITGWTSIDPDARALGVRLSAPIVFCNTFIPGDARSRAQIREDRAVWTLGVGAANRSST